MNFFIGGETTLTGFIQVAPRLFLDQGWQFAGNIWYKGYSTECNISEKLDDIVNGYQPAGKWCVIQDEKIFHPVLRGFHLYQCENILTTLKLPNFQPVPRKGTPTPVVDEQNTITIEEAAYQIGNVLVENTQNFYKYNDVKDLNLYISAGLDTHTCWAVQDQVSSDYTLRADISSGFHAGPKYTHDVITTLFNNCGGFRQMIIHPGKVWTHSGFYAEPYTLRDLGHIVGYANYLNKGSLSELFDENDYCYKYITRPSLVRIYEVARNKVDVSTPNKLREHLWKMIWQSGEAWHVDNNMFFCPFSDLRIPEIAFRMSIDDLIKCKNGGLQRHIIERFAPDRTGLLSAYKNTGDTWYNFKKNFKPSMLGKDTKFIAS